MDTVTYPDPNVVEEVSRHFVPVRLVSADHVEISRKFNIRWLPGVVVTDADERPHHSSVGWLSPKDLQVELVFGRAMAAMTRKQYPEADGLFQKLVEGYPGHERAVDGWYWWGINTYRCMKDMKAAAPYWTTLVEKYPDSLWARKIGWIFRA